MYETDPRPEIKLCPELRDKIFEYLPPKARQSLHGVEVTYWPSFEYELRLSLTYDPAESTLKIGSSESIYGAEEEYMGSLEKECELDSRTGRIIECKVEMVCEDGELNTHGSMILAEHDASRFDQDMLQYFLGLFEDI